MQAQNQQKHSRCRKCGISLKEFCQFLSALILPLTLGIFTVIMTNNQHKEAMRQNARDLEIRMQDQEREDARSESQRRLSREQYEDELLINYMKDMTNLSKANNGSLTSNAQTAILARASTLTTIRQLAGQRSTYILLFLYELGELNSSNVPLNIATAKLVDIDLHPDSTGVIEFERISLTRIVVQHSTFNKTKWYYGDLSFVRFENISFSNTSLFEVDFSSAELKDIDFSYAQLNFVKFSSTKFTNVDFSFAELYNIDFSSAKFLNVKFSNARLFNVSLWSTTLDNVSFAHSNLHRMNVTSAKLTDVQFVSTVLSKVKFSFLSFFISHCHFLAMTNFSTAIMTKTYLTRTDCIAANFKNTNLSQSNFSEVNARDAIFTSADLTGVQFHLTNLLKADFTNATVNENQLNNALSIRDAMLPNSTIARYPNLIQNGEANCNISLVENWKLQSGEIMSKVENNNNCHFVLQSLNSGAVMSQILNVPSTCNSDFWTHCQVFVRANMGSNVFIQLRELNASKQILNQLSLGNDTYRDRIENHLCIIESTATNITFVLESKTKILDVIVNFSASIDQNNSWCDDIYLAFDYGTNDFQFGQSMSTDFFSEELN